MLKPVLFNIGVNDVDEKVQGRLIQSGDDTNLSGIASTLEERKKIQNDGQEQWAENNRMKFNRNKWKVLHLEGKTVTRWGIFGSVIL